MSISDKKMHKQKMNKQYTDKKLISAKYQIYKKH